MDRLPRSTPPLPPGRGTTRLPMCATPVLLLAAGLLGCRAEMGPDIDDQELGRYRILFARNMTALNAPGGTERVICSVKGDGTDLQDLSQHPAEGYPPAGRGYDSSPQYSPDGAHVAFQTNREGNQELYVMRADGANKTNITREGDLDLEFSWSPDGTRLVFTRLFQHNYVLYVCGADWTGLNSFTSPLENCRYPAWSPAGDQIAYSRRVPGTNRWEVITANPDGTHLRTISDSTESAVLPRWSKDGLRVYYNVQPFGIRVKSLDGSFDAFRPGLFAWTISWSPDGQRFVTSDSMGILTVTADLERASRLGLPGFEPSYSPDGKWILFLSRNDREIPELCIAKADGSSERRLLDSGYGDLSPSWRPTLP